MQTDAHSRGVLGYVAQGGILLTVGLAVLALIGWLLGLTRLASFRSDYIPMAPSTALAFLALGGAVLAVMRWPARPAAQWYGRTAAALVLLLSLLILLRPALGLDLEAWLYQPSGFLMAAALGRMSLLTAVAFLLIGFSLLALLAGRRPIYDVAVLLSAGAATIATVVLVGYCYGTPLLYGATIIPVALPTALALLALSSGLLAFIGPRSRFVRGLVGPSVRARILRAFIPTVVGLTLLQGWLGVTLLPRLGILNPALAAAIVALAAGVIVGGVTWLLAQQIAVALDKAEAERQRIEEVLQDSEARFRLAFHDTAVGMALVDTRGCFWQVNPALCRMLGYAEEELLGKPFQEITYPDDRPAGAELFKRVMTGEADYLCFEKRYVCKDGGLIWVLVSSSIIRDLQGRPRYFVSHMQDITERKRVEEEYKTIIRTTMDGFWLVDMRGHFLDVNDAYCNLIGYSREELLTMSIPDVEAVEKPEETAARIRKIMKVGGDRFETRHRCKGGMLVDIEVSVNYMRDEEQMFVFLRDITERKRAEKVQEAIYKISQAAVSTASLEELYRSVHNILGALMTVENFYIALYDPASDMLSFPYFVDQYDRPSLPQKPRRGLTEYILRTGKPLLAPPEVFNQLLQQGEVELVGTNSLDWLGVPLKVGKRMIGVMVTQSYTEKTRFSQKELELLEFVSTQVASAIERKQAEEALRESEQKYKALVETTETGFLILDTEGRVVDANAEYVRLTGHKTLNEILGRTVMEWTAPYDRERNAVEVEKCATTGAVRDLVIDYAGPNGVITPVEINATVVQMAGSTRILSLCRDITARKQTEQLVLTQRDLGLALGTLSDLEQGLRLCLEAAQSVSLMDCGGIYLVDEMTSALNLVVHQGLSPDFIRSVSHYAADSANARLVMAGKPIYTEYFALGVPIDEASQREGLHAIAVIPIQHEGRVIGCLNVASHTRDAVPVFARTALEAVVTQIANVTMRMQAEERVRRNAARAEALAHTAARLNAQLDLDAVLNAVCEETARALNVPATSVTLYDEKREEFEHAATFGMPPAYRARAKPFPRRLFDKYAAQMGPVIVGADVQAILGLPNADLYQALAIRMMVGVTMQRDGRLIGGLNLFTFHQVRHFDDDELALLKGLADQAALAIANARLHDEVRRHAAELEQKVAERTAELSQREAALRAANEQLQQLSRMKSEFVSNVSHELRTPLANIMTYLWLLDHGKPEKHTQYVETLHRESDLLERLIEDLLHLSRLDLGTVQPVLAPVDVNQVVTLLVSDRALLFANRGLTLEARTAPNLPLIQADEKMLIQVLTNLMTNAMNYTPAGGAVTVSTAVRISDFGFRISDSAGDSPQSRCAGREQSAIPLRGTQAVRNLQWVTFSVADTGPGISAEDRVRLFERFYRGEAARQTRTPGTGLGLAICQELVERHGGKITVESEVGQGSTFTVWLPVKGDAVTG